MPRPPRLLNALLLLIPVGFAIGCATAPAPSPDYTPEQLRIHRLLMGIHLPEYVERLETVSLRRAGKPPDGELPREERIRQRIQTQLAPDAVVSDVVLSVSESFNEPAVAQIERFRRKRRRPQRARSVGRSLLRRGRGSATGSSAAPPTTPPSAWPWSQKLDELTLWSETATDLYMRVYDAIVPLVPGAAPHDSRGKRRRGRSRRAGRARAGADGGGRWPSTGFPSRSTRSPICRHPTSRSTWHSSESPAGQWYSKAVREALVETIDRRCEAIQR